MSEQTVEEKSVIDKGIIQQGPQIQAPEDLWSILGDTLESHYDKKTEFLHYWLQQQCINTPSVEQGVLILKRENKNTYYPVAKWPIKAKAERLAKVSEKALAKKRGLLTALDDGSGHIACAYPITVNDELYGVVGIELKENNQQLVNKVMSQLQWSVGLG